MSNGTFPAGYIKRTIIEPIAIWKPMEKVVEEKELPKPIPLTPSVAIAKLVNWFPWIFAGVSLGGFLIAIAITRRKK